MKSPKSCGAACHEARIAQQGPPYPRTIGSPRAEKVSIDHGQDE